MKLLKQLMLGLLCLTVNLAPLGAWTQDEAGLIEETDPWPSIPPRLVRIANNLLTVKVYDASVEELIEEIARQSGLNIVWYGTISERITLDFQGLALDQALARILRPTQFCPGICSRRGRVKAPLHDPGSCGSFPREQKALSSPSRCYE